MNGDALVVPNWPQMHQGQDWGSAVTSLKINKKHTWAVSSVG